MTNAAANIIPTEWKSISLEAMNEKAAMQTRVDRKYIVDAETAAKVLSTLDADASVMEIKGQRDFAYDSVYFDTPRPARLRLRLGLLRHPADAELPLGSLQPRRYLQDPYP